MEIPEIEDPRNDIYNKLNFNNKIEKAKKGD